MDENLFKNKYAVLSLEPDNIASEKHPSIKDSYRKAFVPKRARIKLAKTLDARSNTPVTEVTGEAKGHCCAHEIRAELEKLRVIITQITLEAAQETAELGSPAAKVEAQAPALKVSSPEDRLKGEKAVLCQVAHSLELECKFLYLRAMTWRSKEQFSDTFGEISLYTTETIPLSDLEEALRQENPRKYQRLARKIFPKDKWFFYATLLHMKGDSDSSTTLDGSPVTFEVAKQIIDKMTLSTSWPRLVYNPPTNLDLGAVRAEAHRILALLKDIRKGQELLVEY